MGEIPSTCATMTITMLHDQLDRPYLYVANKEAGLKIYNIANPAAPVPAAAVADSQFTGLEVMNVSQSGNYLYLALGNHFSNPHKGGMAIVDVADPTAPKVTDYYVVPGSASGAGIVKTEGDVAYLGAMKSGLVLLDIRDKSAIKPLSQFMPDIKYPVANPNPDLYNARGMEVNGGVVYLAFDAGGLRIIDCTVKTAPREIGRYVNPALYTPLDHPKAYNNLVLDDSLVYAAVDYCGMEVLAVSDPSQIRLKGWWNPYHCPDNNWFTSPVHANEIRFEKSCKRLYLSTGKSDLNVLDVSDPAHPDSLDLYGGEGNGIGTWGVGLYQGQIYLSYICTLGIPFASNWTGVKILTHDAQCTAGIRAGDVTEALPYRTELFRGWIDYRDASGARRIFSADGRTADPVKF